MLPQLENTVRTEIELRNEITNCSNCNYLVNVKLVKNSIIDYALAYSTSDVRKHVCCLVQPPTNHHHEFSSFSVKIILMQISLTLILNHKYLSKQSL